MYSPIPADDKSGAETVSSTNIFKHFHASAKRDADSNAQAHLNFMSAKFLHYEQGKITEQELRKAARDFFPSELIRVGVAEGAAREEWAFLVQSGDENYRWVRQGCLETCREEERALYLELNAILIPSSEVMNWARDWQTMSKAVPASGGSKGQGQVGGLIAETRPWERDESLGEILLRRWVLEAATGKDSWMIAWDDRTAAS